MNVGAPAVRWRCFLLGSTSSVAGRLLGGLGLTALGGILALAPVEWACAALLIIATSLAILIRPSLAVIAIALLIPFGESLPLPFSGANVVDLLALLSALVWFLAGLRRRSMIFSAPPLTWLLLALVWVTALTLPQAASWREGIPEWLKWAEFVALYLVSTQLLTQKEAWWAVAALFAAGVLQVALGGYQFLRQVGPEAFIIQGRFMRAHGSFGQPNPYAGYLGYLTPVAASLALSWLGRWWRNRDGKALWAGLLCCLVSIGLAGGIGMSWSRGGWLGLAAALIVVFVLQNRATLVLTLAVGIVMGGVALVFGTEWIPAVVTSKVLDLGQYVAGIDPSLVEITDANFSVLERLAHWRAGLAMFADHPWLGVGIGNYGAAYATYAPPHWYDPLGHAHNAYVNFLAETGILGATVFGVTWVSMALFASGVVRGQKSGPPRALGIGVLGTLTYLTMHNLFDNLFVQHLQLQLALLLGALVATTEKIWKQKCPRH